jgi:hypothetical protein
MIIYCQNASYFVYNCGGQVDSGTSLDVLAKGKISAPTGH